MRDSQRQKAYAAERAALAHVTADDIGPRVSEYQHAADVGAGRIVRRLTEENWRRYRAAAVRALEAEAAPLLRGTWWRTVTGWDDPLAPKSKRTALRIAPRNAYAASRGGVYTNGPAISLLHSMTQRRTLYHELAHVAVYGAQRTGATVAAYRDAHGLPDGATVLQEPGHGPWWRGLYVAVLAAAGYPEDADALAAGWDAARLNWHPCPIEPPREARTTPRPIALRPHRPLAADPAPAVVEALTLF